MTHDEAFAELQARKRAEEEATVKVTWRKVSPMTGGGYSGLGPNGQLVFVDAPDASRRHRGYDYGTRDGAVKTIRGSAPTLALAKTAAAKLLGATA